MDFSDIYGGSKLLAQPSSNGVQNGDNMAKRLRSVIHLSLCDILPAYGTIADMAFSLAKDGVSVHHFLFSMFVMLTLL
jgi:cleavage and polyadenylation specificity factor subunit 1